MTLRHIVDFVLAGAVVIVLIMLGAAAVSFLGQAKQLRGRVKHLQAAPLFSRLEGVKRDGERLTTAVAVAPALLVRTRVAIDTLNRAIPRRAIRIAMALASLSAEVRSLLNVLR